MTTAQHPRKDAYLFNVLRRRDDVLWAGVREATGAPTVIAQHVDDVRALLPPGAGDDWRWVDSRWSWADVRSTSAAITRLDAPIRSLSVGPRDDDTFGITLEVERSTAALEEYLAALEPGLVRVVAAGGVTNPVMPSPIGFGTDMPPMQPPVIPAFDARGLDLSDPRAQGPDGLPPGW